MKRVRAGSTIEDLLVMDGRRQDEYAHCTSPGLADRRINSTYKLIRYHSLGCPLAAGVLGSFLPTCTHGSPVLGAVGEVGACPILVYLGFLLVLVCGVLFVLSNQASRISATLATTPVKPWSETCRVCCTRYRKGVVPGVQFADNEGPGKKENKLGHRWMPCMLAW